MDSDNISDDMEYDNDIENVISDDSEDINQINDNNNNNNIDYVELIKKCVNLKLKYENDLKKINMYKKNISEKLKTTNANLTKLMQTTNLDYINISKENGGGKIKYKKKKTYSSISKKHLNNLLPIFFKQININIDCQSLIKFLYDNREFKEKDDIIKTNK